MVFRNFRMSAGWDHAGEEKLVPVPVVFYQSLNSGNLLFSRWFLFLSDTPSMFSS